MAEEWDHLGADEGTFHNLKGVLVGVSDSDGAFTLVARAVGGGEREQLRARLVLLRSGGERVPAAEARGGRPLGLFARGALEEAARRPPIVLESFARPTVLRRDAAGELSRDPLWSPRR